LEALGTAVLRGVAVHLIVSKIPDQVLVGLAQRSYYEELLAAGVTIHRYRDKLLHAKHLTIDGELALIGSSNVDVRSFVLNGEVSLVCYDAAVTAEVRAVQDGYFRGKRPVGVWDLGAPPVRREAVREPGAARQPPSVRAVVLPARSR